MSKLLMIEDEVKDDNSDPFLFALKQCGHEVFIAKTGNDAIKKLYDSKFDCIALDIMVPHGDGKLIPDEIPKRKIGIHILERIVRGDFTKGGNAGDIPVVILTAIIDYDDEIRLKRMLRDQTWYLEKPIRPDALAKVITEALKKPPQQN